MLSSVRTAAVLLTVLATGCLLQLGDQAAVLKAPLVARYLVIAAQAQDLTTTTSGHEYFLSRQEVASSLGRPMPSSNVMVLDIETAENSLPPLARPTLQLRP